MITKVEIVKGKCIENEKNHRKTMIISCICQVEMSEGGGKKYTDLGVNHVPHKNETKMELLVSNLTREYIIWRSLYEKICKSSVNYALNHASSYNILVKRFCR
jgi:hypothetical protein